MPPLTAAQVRLCGQLADYYQQKVRGLPGRERYRVSPASARVFARLARVLSSFSWEDAKTYIDAQFHEIRETDYPYPNVLLGDGALRRLDAYLEWKASRDVLAEPDTGLGGLFAAAAERLRELRDRAGLGRPLVFLACGERFPRQFMLCDPEYRSLVDRANPEARRELQRWGLQRSALTALFRKHVLDAGL